MTYLKYTVCCLRESGQSVSGEVNDLRDNENMPNVAVEHADGSCRQLALVDAESGICERGMAIHACIDEASWQVQQLTRIAANN